MTDIVLPRPSKLGDYYREVAFIVDALNEIAGTDDGHPSDAALSLLTKLASGRSAEEIVARCIRLGGSTEDPRGLLVNTIEKLSPQLAGLFRIEVVHGVPRPVLSSTIDKLPQEFARVVDGSWHDDDVRDELDALPDYDYYAPEPIDEGEPQDVAWSTSGLSERELNAWFHYEAGTSLAVSA